MEWLQKSARAVVAATGQAVKWVVPVTGFPVKQEYYQQEKRQVATILAGKVIKPRVYRNTSKPLTLKQANGISPNVVHSLDAAALVLAVTQSMNRGVTCASHRHRCRQGKEFARRHLCAAWNPASTP